MKRLMWRFRRILGSIANLVQWKTATWPYWESGEIGSPGYAGYKLAQNFPAEDMYKFLSDGEKTGEYVCAYASPAAIREAIRLTVQDLYRHWEEDTYPKKKEYTTTTAYLTTGFRPYHQIIYPLRWLFRIKPWVVGFQLQGSLHASFTPFETGILESKDKLIDTGGISYWKYRKDSLQDQLDKARPPVRKNTPAKRKASAK